MHTHTHAYTHTARARIRTDTHSPPLPQHTHTHTNSSSLTLMYPMHPSSIPPPRLITLQDRHCLRPDFLSHSAKASPGAKKKNTNSCTPWHPYPLLAPSPPNTHTQLLPLKLILLFPHAGKSMYHSARWVQSIYKAGGSIKIQTGVL